MNCVGGSRREPKLWRFVSCWRYELESDFDNLLYNIYCWQKLDFCTSRKSELESENSRVERDVIRMQTREKMLKEVSCRMFVLSIVWLNFVKVDFLLGARPWIDESVKRMKAVSAKECVDAAKECLKVLTAVHILSKL